MFAVIHLPYFSLQAVLRHESGLLAWPVALVDGAGSKPEVIQINPAAAENGVVCGLTASQAMARCAELTIKTRSSIQEQAATEILLQTAYAFAANIEATAPGLCTLELKGLGLQGESALRQWAANLADALESFHLEARVGIAPTPALAALAARGMDQVNVVRDPQEFVSHLPIGALELPWETREILSRWGIRTAGEFLALGRKQVAERLGAPALKLFGQISIHATRPLKLVSPPEEFLEQLEFDHEIETIEPLLLILRRFVEHLARRLEVIHLVVAELRLQFRLSSGLVHAQEFKIPSATGDPEILFRTLCTHLETLRTDSPVVAAQLLAVPCRPETPQGGLFETILRNPNQFAETLARLGALVGAENAGSPVLEATHRPDAFQMKRPDFTGLKIEAPPISLPALQLRRFRPAIPAIIEFHAGKPVSFRSESFHGVIRRQNGPFPLSGHWWRNRVGLGKNGMWNPRMERFIAWFILRTVILWRAFMTDYVELHCRSAFSFLRGASTPEQLAERAAQLQMPAMALCDRNGLYGAPRFFGRAREQGVRAIVGAELTMEDQSILPVLVQSARGYQNLCQLLTRAHLRNEKGSFSVYWNELPEFAEGLVALADSSSTVHQALPVFGPENLFIELQRHGRRGENRQLQPLLDLAGQLRLPLLATNGVSYSTEAGRPILDVFTCIRQHTHLDAAGTLLEPNGERYLKSAAQMRELFRDLPEALTNTVRLAERLEFSLENLGYEFPLYPVPAGHTMDSFLREQAFAGARKRYGDVPEKVRGQMETELALIQKLKVAGYFLIVWDIVKFCREQNIMAQGRGSAANSTVCFCLGITAVDPLKFETLFERFLTEGRKDSWPDIDIDLPSGDRRERVIQEIYRRYGERGAAMTANVITYRGRSAAREIGKALNLSSDVLNRFSNLYANGDFPHTLDLTAQMEKSGLPRNHPRAATFANLCHSLRGLPRHLGQHSGGMIICQGKLDKVMPLENATMPGRIVAQWDKDDCEDLGIIKVDFLGLGMMSVLQDTFELTRQTGRELELATIPENDSQTFELMQRADTIGVFQIESRAQMATLPRLKPKNFYDLVIEVAIIRPGPIQGNLMHPYLARRTDPLKIEYYHDDLKPVLKRTLGVPLFQEQMLKMAMIMADFTGAEAEELRRALSFHRSQERMERVIGKLKAAIQRKGHPAKVVEEICATVSSFALYGFPESHAISFAHLAYASAYLKAHRAPEFFTSLLNNQPMGFYSSATLIQDGQRHGVKFRSVCVMLSGGDCTIEPDHSIRLGLRVVKTLSSTGMVRLLAAREKAPFTSLEDFKRRVRLNRDELRALAEVGALNYFAGHRRQALWKVEKPLREGDLFEKQDADEGASPLAPMNYPERIQADFAGMHLTAGKHPMTLLRPRLRNVWQAADLPKVPDGVRVRIAGNVICRQRPGTAKGVVFISLEDETGVSNAVVMPPLFEANRLVITEEPFLVIEGQLQHRENVIHIKAEKIERLESHSTPGSISYDFH